MTDQQNSPIIPEDVTESVRETMQGYGNAASDGRQWNIYLAMRFAETAVLADRSRRAKAPAEATELAPDVKGLVELLTQYDEAVEWHSHRMHDVGRETAQHEAAAALAEEVRVTLSRLSAPPAEVPRAVAEVAKMVAFFNEPAAFAKWGNDGDHDFLSPADTAIRALRKVLDTGPPPAEAKPVAWSVKPLEWREQQGEWTAPCSFSEYSISFDPDEDIKDFPWCAWGPDNLGHFASIPQAKAAVQADYEQRVLASIVHPDPSAKAAEAVPEGMVLVPREPTEAMIRAGMENLAWWTEPRAPEYEQGSLIAEGLSEEEAAEINDQLISAFKDMYAITLAAAPQPLSTAAVK